MPGEPASRPLDPVAPDPLQIAAFVDAIFAYAEGPFVSLRAFGDGEDKVAVFPLTEAVDLRAGDRERLVVQAVTMAQEAAQRRERFVFCPPLATFSNPRSAKEADLSEGLALSVELDADPAEGLRRLEGIIGPATVLVESGGVTGNGEPKLHAHWRLSEPTREAGAHAALKRARALATALSGGDPSNIAVVHPIRWPGSVHRKGTPRLAQILRLNQDVEFHLDDALEALAEAANAAGVRLALESSRVAGDGALRIVKADGVRLREIASGAVYHDNLRFFAASLVRAGLSQRRARTLLAGMMELVEDASRDERWAARLAAIPDLIDSAATKFPPIAGRPSIRLGGGKLPQIVDACVAALAAHRALDVFCFSGGLARLVEEDVGAGAAPRLRPHPLSKASARDLLTRICAFEKAMRRGKEEVWVETDCPADVAEALLARGEWLGVRILRGIVSTPQLRADGSIAQAEGFDEASGLLLDFRDVVFPLVPETPTKAEAARALDQLKALIRGYLWAGAEDGPDSDAARQNRAAALALFLTAAIRRTLPKAPGFLVDATAPGSGKGKLIDVAAIIATGAPAEIVTMKEAKEETPKVIDAALLSGAPILALDDVEPKHLQCSALRGLITAEATRVRPMSTSAFPSARANLLVTATGNGIALARDMVRRFIVIQIDPRTERPEDRVFDFDPVAEALAQRPALVVACLTILRAYHIAGAPPQKGASTGSFDAWAAQVRDPLLWLGEADPVATTHRMRGSDPAREELAMMMQAWGGAFGVRPTPVAQAMKSRNEALQDAIAAIGCAHRPRDLGDWLRRHKGRRLEGLRFLPEGQTAGATRWRLEGWGVGEGGQGGESFKRAREDG
jgi:putative DNA primase/helicase